jgi:hypothetical protein
METDVKSMLQRFKQNINNALEDGTLTEEMKAQLAEDGVLAQMESATAQDKLNAAMEKMQDLFVGLIELP